MTDNDGVIETDELPTLTVITDWLTHAPTVFVTVYVVVMVGDAVVIELEGLVKEALGDQEYVPAPPLAVKVKLCPAQIIPVGV